jgi:hypothetical protein
MSRYLPARGYLWAGLALTILAAYSGWKASLVHPAIFAFVPLTLVAGICLFLGLRPPIELRPEHLVIGRRAIRWADIRRVDRFRLRSPLVVRLKLAGGAQVVVIYPGKLDSANSLLRHIRRSSRQALIEGRPYREFWGEALPAARERKELASPRYRLLLAEDEAEVERLYQQLRTAGHIDSKSSADET